MVKFKGFCDGMYELDDRELSHQECINFYPEIHEGGSTLQPTGGYEDYVDFDDGGNIRAVYRTSTSIGEELRNDVGDLIVVSGGNVYWVKSDKSFQLLGIITNVLNQIDIVDDGVGICIVDGSQMYRVDMVTLEFTVVDFTEIRPTKLAVLNFRTIAIGIAADEAETSNRFFYSDIADNATWSSINFFELKSIRDPILNISADTTRLYLFTADAYQMWQINGNSITKPFRCTALGLDEVGIHAKDSLCQLAGTQYFLGSIAQGSPVIYKANGSAVEKISTTAIDKALTSEVVTDCTSYAYTENGHSFVVFNFDIMDRTFVYDEMTKKWHSRMYRDNHGLEHRWQPQYVDTINGNLIMGSRDESKLYLYSNSIYTQSDSGEILRRRTSPNLKSMWQMMTTNRITIDALVGRGIPDTILPSTLMLRYAYDGGYSGWSDRLEVSLGRRGNYMMTPEFGPLGTGRALIVELSISDSCNCAIHDLYLFNKVSGRRG